MPDQDRPLAPAAVENLRKAIALHQAGDLGRAEQGYRAVLAAQPDSADALHYLGLLEAQRGRFPDALSLLDRALVVAPSYFDALVCRGNVQGALGRPRDALASYEAALAINGDSPIVHFNLGNAYQLLGRAEDALASYDRALVLEPNEPDALNNRGNALFDLHRFEEALASYERAIAARRDFPEALNNRGNTLRELNRPQDALASCKQALALRPDFAEAHNNLGNILKKLNRPDEAIASFRKAVTLEPRFAEAHSNLGNVLRDHGRLDEAVASYRRAVELTPGSIDANINLSVAQLQAVPGWHLSMMNDAERNEAYVAALTAAVTKETDVLEIGTGSGLLAMIAARLGARQVVTCEAVSLIADTARKIVAANGLQSSIKVVAKVSTDLAVGADLPRRANVLVSEILASELLGEGVLASIEDAKRRLLDPGAKIIPAAGSVVFALFGGEAVRKNIMVDEVLGFDLSAFNAIASPKRYINRHDLDAGLLTDTAEAFEFDFTQRDYFPPESRTVRVPIAAAGRCYGVAQWIRLRLDDKVTFENHPSMKTPATSWQTCFYRFPKPVDVRPGQTAIVRAAHNRTAVWFFFEGLEG